MEASEDYGQIDNDHLETIFVAMDDTMGGVTGSEGFGLTRAQEYTYAVLGANDSLTRQQKVDGNESFFGSIGDGLKAVWEYVQKLFKSIWGFFFGKKEGGAQAEIDNTKEALTVAKVALEKPSGDTKAVQHKLVESMQKVVADPVTTPAEVKEVQELIQVIQATPAPSPAETKKVAEKFAKLNHKQQKKLQTGLKLVKEKGAGLVAHITKLHTDVEIHVGANESYNFYKHLITEIYNNDISAIRSAINHIDGAMIVSDMGQGARVLEVLQHQMKTIDSINGFIKANKHNLEHRITECEKALSWSDKHAERKAGARAELAVAKDMMIAINSTVSYVHTTCLTIQSLCDTVRRIFGLK
jgi:hypothetical protein